MVMQTHCIEFMSNGICADVGKVSCDNSKVNHNFAELCYDHYLLVKKRWN